MIGQIGHSKERFLSLATSLPPRLEANVIFYVYVVPLPA